MSTGEAYWAIGGLLLGYLLGGTVAALYWYLLSKRP